MSLQFKPDFILIPYQLVEDRQLEPTDRLVYGLIYWFEHLKDGACTASNVTFAALLHTTTRAIQNSLTNLEDHGYINREYKDSAKRHRTFIHAKVSFKAANAERTVGDTKKKSELAVTLERTGGDTTERTVGDQSNIILNKTTELDKATPGEVARKFFSGDKATVLPIAQKISNQGVPKDLTLRELLKFKNYWTEPTKNGKKQRWELQKTFDVERRLGTWFRNIAERSTGTRRSGAGITV